LIVDFLKISKINAIIFGFITDEFDSIKKITPPRSSGEIAMKYRQAWKPEK